jgi:hypothetical protein
MFVWHFFQLLLYTEWYRIAYIWSKKRMDQGQLDLTWPFDLMKAREQEGLPELHLNYVQLHRYAT